MLVERMLTGSAVDIKELKLLGDFDHPNIVRFVRTSVLAVRPSAMLTRSKLAWRKHPREY